jgi:organic radical activating enzyme
VSLDVRQVEEHILQFGCPRLVITGGEPLLQQKELAPLVASLKRKGFYCEVETNGTILPLPGLAQEVDQWNVSPKLHTSGNSVGRRELPKVLNFFAQLPNAYFKFVVVEPSDIGEVCSLRDRYGLPGERIILMPEGRTVECLQNRSQWVSEACVRASGFLPGSTYCCGETNGAGEMPLTPDGNVAYGDRPLVPFDFEEKHKALKPYRSRLWSLQPMSGSKES